MPENPPAGGSADGQGAMLSIQVIGAIEQYVQGEDFSQYKSRLNQFFIGNAVNEARKVALAITLMGPTCYSVLVSLVAPQKPEEKSYAEIMTTLEHHFKPTNSTMFQGTP